CATCRAPARAWLRRSAPRTPALTAPLAGRPARRALTPPLCSPARVCLRRHSVHPLSSHTSRDARSPSTGCAAWGAWLRRRRIMAWTPVPGAYRQQLLQAAESAAEGAVVRDACLPREPSASAAAAERRERARSEPR